MFETEPIFSKDKKFIFGYSNDYEGYHMNIREIGLERNLRYTLRGKYDLNHFKLYQFENSNKELLINLNKIIERDENFNLINKKVCNLTLIIN